MELSTRHLVLDADSAVDMQLHTTYSDGTWTPEQLMDYLVAEGFGLVAITDHDRVDSAADLQALAAKKQLPLLVAAEMSTSWRGQYVDVLCFGFDPDHSAIRSMIRNIRQGQNENTQQVYDYLRKRSYLQTGMGNLSPEASLQTILEKPATRHPHEMVAWLRQIHPDKDGLSIWNLHREAGGVFATNPIAKLVDAVHASGGVCLIAHPGRGEFYPVFDANLLDEVRREAALDGFEAYYPMHTPAQTAMYVAYAERYNLLTSSGSDSHGANRNPIKYPAGHSRKLLERLGVHVNTSTS